jgi:hypothetical protein
MTFHRLLPVFSGVFTLAFKPFRRGRGTKFARAERESASPRSRLSFPHCTMSDASCLNLF